MKENFSSVHFQSASRLLLDEELERPALVYVTTTDEDKTQKIKAWEDSRLCDDKLYVATKTFDCYILDENNLSKDDPLKGMLKRHRAPSFVVFHHGKVLYGSGSKPSASKAYSMMKKCISKVYKLSLDKIVKEGLEIKMEIEKIKDAKKELDKKLAKLMDEKNSKKKDKYRKEKEELEQKEQTFRQQEEELYNLPVKVTVRASR